MSTEQMVLTHKDCASITNGFSLGKFTLTNLSINSKTIVANEIFLALKGKNLDGHDFIQQAFVNGAQAAIISEEFYNNNKNLSKYNLLVVKDTYKALIDIAKYRRNSFKGKVVAITGSMGKTTLKDMLVCSLKKYFKVHYSVGNYNNHIGLPLSLTNLNNSYGISVLELGMSCKGDISFLTNLVKPDIATITEVTAAHLEFFSSIEEILEAKLEILEGLHNDSYFFINRSSVFFGRMLEACREAHISNIVYFNDDKIVKTSSTIVSEPIILQDKTRFITEVKVNIQNEEISYKLQSIYAHNIMLSALALSIGKILQCPVNCLIRGIESFTPTKGRGNIFMVKHNRHDVVVIDDSYNANYQSMKAAILATNIMHGYKKILILGEMLELGVWSDSLHNKLLEPILQSNANLVILLGSNILSLYKVIKNQIQVCWFSSWEEAYEVVLNEITNQSLILLKGSHSSGVYNIANSLLRKK